ncbi:MAG: hypothetical protein J7502_16535 [Flavisolibacter sp.]|nr:hypothetical protein [Flavisolibacter sp.]
MQFDTPVLQIGCKYRFSAVFGSLQAECCRVGTAQPLLLVVFQTQALTFYKLKAEQRNAEGSNYSNLLIQIIMEAMVKNYIIHPPVTNEVSNTRWPIFYSKLSLYQPMISTSRSAFFCNKS